VYCLLTFAVAWTAWWASAELAGTSSVLFGLGGPVFLVGVFAPSLVAIALTALRAGREGVVRLIAPIGWWQVSAGWYLFAIAYTPAIKLLGAVIHRILTGEWPVFGTTPWLLMLAAVALSTWVQAGEEVGWRGYLLPALARYLGLAGASLVLGVVWAAWHLPLFFMEGSGSDGQSFPIYALHVTALSVAMAWLFWGTGGSLLLVMVMHASVNNTIGIVPAALPYTVDSWSVEGSPMAWITIGLSWAVMAVLLLRMRGARLAR
jgi:membrane protease YdiL (CAAX protease family)